MRPTRVPSRACFAAMALALAVPLTGCEGVDGPDPSRDASTLPGMSTSLPSDAVRNETGSQFGSTSALEHSPAVRAAIEQADEPFTGAGTEFASLGDSSLEASLGDDTTALDAADPWASATGADEFGCGAEMDTSEFGADSSSMYEVDELEDEAVLDEMEMGDDLSTPVC